MPEELREVLFAPPISNLLRILLALLLLALALELVRRAAPRVTAMLMRLEQRELAALGESDLAKRQDTLRRVLQRTAEVLLIAMAFFTILREIGFDITPIIAAVGIAGLAIGFGAQHLVRDLLGGIFIIMENQYGTGDVVRIADTAGFVEDIGLRRTVLRDLDGIVHNIPNGEIRVASNFTRGYSRVNLDVTVGYEQDLDRVRDVIDRVGAELATDPEWAPSITEAPKVLRVDAFADSGVVLKILATTQPLRQWAVAGELRRRLKATFDAEGIRIPYPHRVVVMQPQGPSPVEKERAAAE